MTCEHCKDKTFDIIDNTGGNQINLHDMNYCTDVGCALPTIFCMCECHQGIRADMGVQ